MRFGGIVIIAIGLVVTFPSLAVDVSQQQVDQIFAAYNKPGSPGCALGVIRDGNFIYRKAYGIASLELGVPLSPQSVFYMGSVAKQFTAASVVLAAEQGFLSLDDNVRKYIPELPDYGQAITLRRMLHHTSGFRDYADLLILSDRHDSDFHAKDEVMDLIARQKGLNNVPGGEYIYSNTNYFLLGEVVKRATKKSLANFAAENIFQPLGMVHTRFYDDHTLVMPGRVPAYDPGSDGHFLVDWDTNFELTGAGGLMSSVDDLILWDRNFYKNRLGKGTLVKELQTRGVLNNGLQIPYALGLEVGTYGGLPFVEHGGSRAGYNTDILRFPEQQFTVLCLCNLSSAPVNDLSRKVADVYLEKIMQTKASEPQPSGAGSFPDPSPFAGRYLDPRSHQIYSFSVSAGNLTAWGGSLRRIGPNQFNDLLGTGILTFENSEGGKKVSLEYGGQIVFSGRRIEEQHVSDAALTAFAGLYTSPELDATYNFSTNKGSLTLRYGRNPPLKLTPIAQDEFDGGDFGILVFHRDADHRISGLSVNSGDARARNVSFQKTH